MVDVCHTWFPYGSMPYISLQGYTCATVRTEASPNGRFMWQFRKVVGYCDTVEEAKDMVESGAEFFQTFRRNPWG